MAQPRLTRRAFMRAVALASGGLLARPDRSHAGRRVPESPPADSGEAPGVAGLEPFTVSVGDHGIALQSGSGAGLSGCTSALWTRSGAGAPWGMSRNGAFAPGAGHEAWSLTLGDTRADLVIEPLSGGRLWKLSGTLTHRGRRPIELARFHYLDGIVPSDLRFLELAGPEHHPALRSGVAGQSPRRQTDAFWESAHVQWTQDSDPVHDEDGWFISTDVAALVPDWNRPGWGFGFTGPGSAFGEIGYRGPNGNARAYVAVLLDGVRLDPGETRPLESVIVWCGDWQAGLEAWAVACAAEQRARAPGPSLVGYCSWYQKIDRITPHDIDVAARAFASWPSPPGGRTLQIDDGFQARPGDWEPNARFAHAWPELVRRITASGAIPGLWLAPTAVHEHSRIARDHPEWLQRLSDGRPAITFSNWGPTHYLEPDHPGVRHWLEALFAHFRAEGWRYFKLDFTYAITAARTPPDPRRTTFQSLRDLYALIRRALGPDILINACTGTPARYALGFADAARLGDDMVDHWPAVRSSVRQLLTRTSTSGTWWQGDPDCFTMNGSRLTPEERRLLTGTVGLFGGLLLTSDLPSQWSPEDQAFVHRFWTADGPRTPRHHRVAWDADGFPRAWRVSYRDGRAPGHRVALYNWSDLRRTSRVTLAEAGLDASRHVRIVPNATVAGAILADGALQLPDQPPHSLRIVDLD